MGEGRKGERAWHGQARRHTGNTAIIRPEAGSGRRCSSTLAAPPPHPPPTPRASPIILREDRLRTQTLLSLSLKMRHSSMNRMGMRPMPYDRRHTRFRRWALQGGKAGWGSGG